MSDDDDEERRRRNAENAARMHAIERGAVGRAIDASVASWAGHGTKILGVATATAAFLQAADPALIKATLGAGALPWIQLLLGVLTIWRGFSNSRVQAK